MRIIWLLCGVEYPIRFNQILIRQSDPGLIELNAFYEENLKFDLNFEEINSFSKPVGWLDSLKEPLIQGVDRNDGHFKKVETENAIYSGWTENVKLRGDHENWQSIDSANRHWKATRSWPIANRSLIDYGSPPSGVHSKRSVWFGNSPDSKV